MNGIWRYCCSRASQRPGVPHAAVVVVAVVAVVCCCAVALGCNVTSEFPRVHSRGKNTQSFTKRNFWLSSPSALSYWFHCGAIRCR